MGKEKSEWPSDKNLIRICEAPLSLFSIEFNVGILDIPKYILLGVVNQKLQSVNFAHSKLNPYPFFTYHFETFK